MSTLPPIPALGIAHCPGSGQPTRARATRGRAPCPVCQAAIAATILSARYVRIAAHYYQVKP